MYYRNTTYRFIVFTIIYVLYINVDAQNTSIIFEENFDTDVLSEWKIIDDIHEKSNWFLDEGHLCQDSNIGESKDQLGTNIIKKDLLLDNFTLRTKMYSTDDDYIGIVFRYVDSDNYYRFILSSQRKKILLQKRFSGVTSTLDSYTDEEWHYVGFTTTITAYNNEIKVYLNDKLFLETQDSDLSKGSIGFMSCFNNGNFFDWIRIYDSYEIAEPNNKLSLVRNPYIQNLTDSSVVILWGTNYISEGSLQIGLDSTSFETIKGNLSTTHHQINVTVLNADTKYYYRVLSREVISEWKSFSTIKSNPTDYSFLVYGDSQNNFLRHTQIVSHFSDHNFDFIAHCGDVVQRGIRNDWNVEYFEPLKEYLSEKPVYVSIGNHQLNSENFYTYLEMPNSEHENYFSFKYGNSYFIFIDNRSAAYPEVTYYPSIKVGSPQYIWLEKQLSSNDANNAEWIFVFSHVPSYHNFSLDAYPDNTDYLVPLFEQYGVDFNFSGHIHGYERGIRNNVNYVTTAGGGGVKVVKDDGFINPTKPLTNYPFRKIYNFCKVEVNGSELTFSAFDIFGNKIDTKNDASSVLDIMEDINDKSSGDSFGAYPNPFNSEIVFEYDLENSSNVSIKLFNVLGQQIDSLINEYRNKGKYRISYNFNKKSSNVYFAQIVTERLNQTIKILQSK